MMMKSTVINIVVVVGDVAIASKLLAPNDVSVTRTELLMAAAKYEKRI